MPRILSVNIGQVVPQKTPKGRDDRTGIGKRPVDGPVRIGPSGLDGDQSAYRTRERGDTAVHIYCAESYAKLNVLAGRDLPVPCFGENLTVEGYTEEEARVGDVIRAGTALLRVNQPVIRCWWPTVQSGETRLTKWATQGRLTGFYLDVVEPGMVQAGDVLEIVSRGPAGWTISAINAVYYTKPMVRADIDAALALPELADRFKADLRELLTPA